LLVDTQFFDYVVLALLTAIVPENIAYSPSLSKNLVFGIPVIPDMIGDPGGNLRLHTILDSRLRGNDTESVPD
jgi:hypothetical protein